MLLEIDKIFFQTQKMLDRRGLGSYVTGARGDTRTEGRYVNGGDTCLKVRAKRLVTMLMRQFLQRNN